jgi:hypothetical protein
MTDISESVAEERENEGPSINCATSKLATLKEAYESEGIRTENFRPKLSTVPENDIPVFRRGVAP